MSDTWNDIQAVKSRQSSLREKRDRLKKLMQDINQSDTDPPENRTDESNAVSLSSTTKATLSVETSKATTSRPGNTGSTSSSSVSSINPTKGEEAHTEINKQVSSIREKLHKRLKKSSAKLDPELIVKLENEIQFKLSDVTLNFPMEGSQLMSLVCKKVCPADVVVPAPVFDDLLHKLSAQQLISLNPLSEAREGESVLLIVSADTTKLGALGSDQKNVTKKRQHESDDEPPNAKQQKTSAEPNKDSVESLLATHTAKERENKKMNEEILQLLSKPSAKEQSLVEKFKSQGGASVQEFCQFGTINECLRSTGKSTPCDKLHFKKIINSHTDESLGDCSFLNTCFHMATCKYVHYEINTADQPSSSNTAKAESNTIAKKSNTSQDGTTVLFPPQWVQCDVRKLDMSVLGKFAVIMADPPWDIHMELPYGTMGDDEMRSLDVPNLQDEGYIFLWVTGRAMELGRECLMLWGYERVDELIWVKTNQLQRIIRTGRTGHWLNHGKEHCLVGVKGEPKNMNRGLDCDVIVAEVRATSHKPDEIYGIIERLSPGTRKLELFGRPHNVQPNWITLGNQLDGVRLLDPDVVGKFKKRYPDGKGLS